jgi:CubicO group peptidase (beta-lactamase class C family)
VHTHFDSPIIEASFDQTLAARLDDVFATALREKRIVGAVAIVARHGDIVYRQADGLAEREA